MRFATEPTTQEPRMIGRLRNEYGSRPRLVKILLTLLFSGIERGIL